MKKLYTIFLTIGLIFSPNTALTAKSIQDHIDNTRESLTCTVENINPSSGKELRRLQNCAKDLKNFGRYVDCITASQESDRGIIAQNSKIKTAKSMQDHIDNIRESLTCTVEDINPSSGKELRRLQNCAKDLKNFDRYLDCITASQESDRGIIAQNFKIKKVEELEQLDETQETVRMLLALGAFSN